MKFDIRDRETAKVIAVCALLTALVWGVFGQTMRFEFINYDDDQCVYESPIVARGLSLAGLRWAVIGSDAGLWNPLSTISHMLDCQLYGLWAGGHHLTNVLLHAACAVLLFLALREMTGALWRCAFVAALFAIHPLRAESVAWVVERKDVLSGVFFMLTLWAYARYARRPESWGCYGMVALWFALGLISKPMLVTVPFVLLLMDYWPLGRLQSRRQLPGLLIEKLPLAALSILSGVVTVLKHTRNAEEVMQPSSLSQRIGSGFVGYVIYLWKLIYPVGLAVFYPAPQNGWPIWLVIASIILLGALTAGAWALRRSQPFLLAGWLWYLGMLAPLSGIVSPGRAEYADRYTYLPQVGLCLAGVWAAAKWAGERRARSVALATTGAALLSILSVAAWRQTGFWRDSITLWTHALDVTRDNSTADGRLGNALMDQGRTTEGIAELREARRIDPVSALTHNDLGIALLQQGDAGQGIAELREALRISPAFPEAHCNLGNALLQAGWTEEGLAEFHEGLRINPFSAEAHFILGGALVRLGRAAEGIAEFREALQINPDYVDAHDGLGMALLGQGRTAEGFAELREALRINPASADAHKNLGIALFRDGQAEEGIAELREASKLAPAFAEAHNNLGNALVAQGRTDEAIAELREAVRLNPAYQRAHYSLGKALLATGKTEEGISELRDASRLKPDPALLRTLAAAYAREGKYSDAIRTTQSALQLPETREVAGALRSDIKLYEAGRPLPDGQ